MSSGPLAALAIAAHPDDAELSCGGTLARLAREGKRVGILDLTRGELASRGSPAERAQEARRAGEILGLAVRQNLGLPDGGIEPRDPEQRLALVRALRELRPTLLLLPWLENRHPDHTHAAELGLEAAFRAGLGALETGTAPMRPALVLHYLEQRSFEPTLVVDVSADHETKLRALGAYASQFHAAADDPAPSTYLTRPEFLEGIAARGRHFGELAGCAYGEPFRSRTPLLVSALELLLQGRQT